MLASSGRLVIVTCACIFTLLEFVTAVLEKEARFVYNHPAAFPSVVLIGTLKGGTTDLFEQLTDLQVNDDPLRPDPPMKTRYEFNRTWEEKELANLYHPETVPEEWFPGKDKYMFYLYRLRHPCANVSVERLRRCVNAAGLRQFTMDATPGYLRSPTSPIRLATISPYSKVLAMLREPIRRAQSLFYHFRTHNDLWRNITLDGLTDHFFDVLLKTTPGMTGVLRGLADCKTVDCHAMGWRELAGLGDIQDPVWILYFGSLYGYGLAGWQQFYLQPGRTLIIDSHDYYRNRTAIIERVIYFLYGRSMTHMEAAKASASSIANLGIRRYRVSQRGPGAPWMLSQYNRDRLYAFYKEHFYDKFPATLQQLRDAGAWVVGFQGEPWNELMDTTALMDTTQI